MEITVAQRVFLKEGSSTVLRSSLVSSPGYDAVLSLIQLIFLIHGFLEPLAEKRRVVSDKATDVQKMF